MIGGCAKHKDVKSSGLFCPICLSDKILLLKAELEEARKIQEVVHFHGENAETYMVDRWMELERITGIYEVQLNEVRSYLGLAIAELSPECDPVIESRIRAAYEASNAGQKPDKLREGGNAKP